MPSKSKGGSGGKPRPTPGNAEAALPLVVNGWIVLPHPLLLDQFERLIVAAEAERAKRKEGAPDGPNTKLAAAILHLMMREVPEDPSRSRYRHGGALAEELKHWLRAKFGNGRFRLFFRYRSSDPRIIVFVWVNDSDTLRTYGSSTDAYTVFRRMLGGGNPPDDWEALVRAASAPENVRRAQELLGRAERPGND